MWSQWPGVATAAPMPPIPAPQCPPPQPPPPSAAPPPPSTAPTPTATEQSAGSTANPVIGPMLPTAAVTPAAPSGPYGQYTEAQYAALTPEQQYALQQHWQQWQAYQQEYAKWHAQYGEQYKREMAAATAGGQTMNYYQQAQQQPQMPTQPQIPAQPQVPTQPQMPSQLSQQQAQQPPPPPPPDASQNNSKITGNPQIYAQPPPIQHQPQAQSMPGSQGPPPMHQPPPGQFQNMNYQQWQQSYPQNQQQQQYNYNQPPPNFSQPPNFGQNSNFQQPPPMSAQGQSQSQQMPNGPQCMQQQQPMPSYGNSNQNRNENYNNNMNSKPTDIGRPNNWAPPSRPNNDFNKSQNGNNTQWNTNKISFDSNFSGGPVGQSGTIGVGPNNWDSRKNNNMQSKNFNDLPDDEEDMMNDPFEDNPNSSDGFDHKRNSNSRWGGMNPNLGPGSNNNRNENFPSDRQGLQRDFSNNPWNNNNRNQGGMNNSWNNRGNDLQENERRNAGNFNSHRNQFGPRDQGGNRWGNNSSQWCNNDRNERDTGFNNNFNQGPGGNDPNMSGNNFSQAPNNNFNQRYGQNNRFFGGNNNQRPDGNNWGGGPNDNMNQRFGNNGQNNSFRGDNFSQNNEQGMRSRTNERSFGNKHNFNRWGDNNDANFGPRNNFIADDGNDRNPLIGRSRSNDRNFEMGNTTGNISGRYDEFDQRNRGSGRNFGSDDRFQRSGSNDRKPGRNNFNRRSDSNERNFGQNVDRRSNSKDRAFGNSNFNKRANSKEPHRETGPNLNARGEDDNENLQGENKDRNNQNEGNRDIELTNQQKAELDEKSFDMQFQKWQEQFEQWKLANANHPDREMYRRYELEFEKQRQRIMERREQMRLRRVQLMGKEEETGVNNPIDQDDREANKPSENVEEAGANEDDAESKDIDNKAKEEESSEQPPSKTSYNVVTETENFDKTEEEITDEKENEVKNENKDEEINNTNSYGPENIEEISKNTELLKEEKNTKSNLGKRKSRFSSPVDNTKTAKISDIQTTEVISLVEEESATKREQLSGPMCNIFGKSEGIPGLDLVEGSSEIDNIAINNKASGEIDNIAICKQNIDIFPEKRDTKETSPYQQQPKLTDIPHKIPSLFDVVVEKPADFPVSAICDDDDDDNIDKNDNIENHCKDVRETEQQTNEQKIQQNLCNAIPNLSDALREPDFMKKISLALAKAQGLENPDPTCAPPPQFLQQLPMLLQKLQQQRDDMGRDVATLDREGPSSSGTNQNIGGNGPNLGGNCPNFGGDGPNFGGNRANLGGNGRNFGGHGPNFGGNGPNFGGNGRNFGGNGPNYGNIGPDFRGNVPDFRGNCTNFRVNGPNRPHFGADGPNFSGNNSNFGGNGPNFRGNGRNFSGTGLNRNGPNFNRFGPNGPNGQHFSGVDCLNFRGGSGPVFGGGGDDPNFRGSNGPNFRDGNGPDFDGGNGQNFQGDGGNFRNNSGTNFGRNTYESNNRGNQGSFQRGGNNTSIGPDDNERKKGDDGFNATETDNSNSSWANGPGNSSNYGDEYYRPVQVIDYQNSTIPIPKVIDYGHMGPAANIVTNTGCSSLSNSFKSSMSEYSDAFKPVQTFDYGHASSQVSVNSFGNLPSNVNNKRRNKKKKKKNVIAPQNPQASQADNTKESESSVSHQEINNETENKNEIENEQPTENSTAINDIKVSSPKGTAQAFEEISENEDDLEADRDNESPAPPPPPMLTTNKPYVCIVQSTSTAPPQSLFPSTADANENVPILSSNHVQMSFPSIENKNTISIDEVLLKPGRLTRPKKICVILRGPPGSGKSFVAKLIKEKEIEMGGGNPRILSMDDYFLIENDYEERCPKTGKKISKREVLYEYDADMEDTYMQYLIKSFKKTISDNLYDFIIIDCNNNSLRTLNEFYCHSKDSGFMPYIVDLLCELETCLSRNIHERAENDIKLILHTWKPTPFHYIKLDVTSLLENVVEMEDAEDMVMDNNSNSCPPDDTILKQPEADNDNEPEDSNEANNDDKASFGFLKSKWENDTMSENLARLDGTNKLMHKRKVATMSDYLQVDDWEPPKISKNGKKRVRWADIEEKRTQDKMRAIGFVVGQTDWKRMMDPNAGNRALNKTKYIERLNHRR